ncbi:toll/interleukin-1 receptor domain-containing protein [Pareuzebyella sediminis]|uniref:toll/interleukin-1 receptor domain-containing protein n=1 Tax=Pareuzebyella sediminis TaxID=2607998 RepID=UPI0011EE6A2D|nr:toll/interleukin-1 receptor domain-containing protein [Pareuzebyella sediminis]
MQTATNFEIDIFISYAHKDNIKQNEGWVKKFVESLHFDLERLTGTDINIWIDDRKLDGNEFFDPKIQESVDKAAIMLCFNSPSYRGSDWCKKEVSLFHQKSLKEGLDMGHSSRIVNVLLYDMPIEDWLPEFADRTGFHFHEKVENKEDWVTADPLELHSTAFNEEMKKLRTALFKLIKQFKNQSVEKEATSIMVDLPRDDEFTIYFADAPESLLSLRKTLISSLQKKGYKIILNSQDAREAKAHEEECHQVLEHANLAIHLLDQYPGLEIEGDPDNWYRKKQVEVALKSSVPQLIYMSSQIDIDKIESEPYRVFIQSLERGTPTDASGNSLDKNYEFIVDHKSGLTQEVLNFIEVLMEKKMAEELSKKVGAHDELDILLDYNVEDKSYAMELQKSFDKYKFVTHYAPLGQDPEKNQKILQRRMDEVKKLVFIYGKSSRDWVQSRINTVANKLLWNDSPIEDIYIYAAPPDKASNDDLMLKVKNINGVPVNIIDYSKHEVLDTNLLEQFISNIKGESNAKQN